MISLKLLFRLIALLIGAVLLWAFWFYQPERQLERAHQRLLKAVESRNWKAIREMTTDDFKAGVYDKTEAIEVGHEVLRQFFSIKLTESDRTWRREPAQSVLSARLHMEGRGAGFADAVRSTVNRQKEPFVFTWQRMSRKPWDWKLVKAEHPLFF